MELADTIVGWIAVGFGVLIPIPQLHKIIKTSSSRDVALGTYIAIVSYIICALFHAVYIQDLIFIIIQCTNLVTNSIVLSFILYHRRK